MTPEQITAIIVAVLASNGALTTLIVVIAEAIKRKSDKKSGIQKELVEIKEQIEKTSKKLDEHIAKSERAKILNFQEDILKGERKTFEKFDEIIDSIEFYEKFCKDNDIKNDKITLATEYIYEVYKGCKKASALSSTSTQMIGDEELKKIIADVLAQNKH